MAQEGYDTLMSLTDSRYRLTMIAARRAAQLKAGVPHLLEDHELPPTSNTVTIAMKEFELGKPIDWGEELPSTEEIVRGLNLGTRDTERQQEFTGFGQPRE